MDDDMNAPRKTSGVEFGGSSVAVDYLIVSR